MLNEAFEGVKRGLEDKEKQIKIQLRQDVGWEMEISHTHNFSSALF